MLPNFVIIGAQKSASTYLQACLGDHPDVFLPLEEIPFFESPDYEHSNVSDLGRIFEKRSEKCLGIKRPNYIGRPEVPQRIESCLPHAKLIAVLRNPIDRAISAYYHNINYGFIPPIDVENGLRRIINEPSFLEKYKRAHEVIEFGYYYKYLSQYEYFIKNGRLLAFLYEDILSNPLESIQKAYKFLGVPHDFIPKSLSSRPQQVLYNLTRLKLISIRNRFIYDYNLERTRLFVKKRNFVGKAVARIITMIDMKILSRFLSNDRPKVSSELRQILYEIYASDINALEGLIGRDLTTWRPNKTSI